MGNPSFGEQQSPFIPEVSLYLEGTDISFTFGLSNMDELEKYSSFREIETESLPKRMFSTKGKAVLEKSTYLERYKWSFQFIVNQEQQASFENFIESYQAKVKKEGFASCVLKDRMVFFDSVVATRTVSPGTIYNGAEGYNALFRVALSFPSDCFENIGGYLYAVKFEAREIIGKPQGFVEKELKVLVGPQSAEVEVSSYVTGLEISTPVIDLQAPIFSWAGRMTLHSVVIHDGLQLDNRLNPLWAPGTEVLISIRKLETAEKDFEALPRFFIISAAYSEEDLSLDVEIGDALSYFNFLSPSRQLCNLVTTVLAG